MTEKAKSSFCAKKYLLSLFVLCVGIAEFFSASSDIAQETAWVLAARKFEVDSAVSKSAEAAASVLPKLILERISVDAKRDVRPDEKIARKTDALLTERLSLFLQLSKEMQARDALVLKNSFQLEFQLALNDEQKKIKEIQDKIDENLKKQELIFHPEKAKRRVAKEMQKEFAPGDEIITLYKNDPESLFQCGEEAERAGVYSRSYEKAANSEKINSLISGKLVFYGDYVSASVELVSYPEAKKIAGAMEVGSLSQISRMAENLAFALLPKIVNGLPVELSFDATPEDVLKDAVLTIDNVVYERVPDKAVVSSGVHSISFETKGYARETFVYNFTGRRRFFVEVNFKEESQGAVKLVLSRFTPGNLFFDGKFAGPSSKTDYVDVPLKVNGDTVFGYFEGTLKDKRHPENDKSEMMFLQIPSRLMKDGNLLETNVKVFDISKNIDKRRKMMYISYSALVLSLPFLFYTYGRFVTYQRAWSAEYGSVDYSEYNRYRQLSLWATGISAACGVWFVAELVAYLIAVDKTLPPKARKVRARTTRKMENARNLEAFQAMMEGEAKAISPMLPDEPKDAGGSEEKMIGPEEK